MAIDWGLATNMPSTQGFDADKILDTMMKRETMNQEQKLQNLAETRAAAAEKRAVGLDKREIDQYERDKQDYDEERTRQRLYDEISGKADYNIGVDLDPDKIDYSSAEAAFKKLDESPDDYENQLISSFLEGRENLPPGIRKYLADELDFNDQYDTQRRKIMKTISNFVTPDWIDEHGTADPVAAAFLGHLTGDPYAAAYARFATPGAAGFDADTGQGFGQPKGIFDVKRGGDVIPIMPSTGSYKTGKDSEYDRALAKQLQSIVSGDTPSWLNDTIDGLQYKNVGDGVFEVKELDTFGYGDPLYMRKNKNGEWEYSEDQVNWIPQKGNLDTIRDLFE